MFYIHLLYHLLKVFEHMIMQLQNLLIVHHLNFLLHHLNVIFNLHINEGANYVWESYRLEPFVHKFSEAIYTFQERVDELISVENLIDLELKSLDSCPYKQQSFQDILGKIQKSVDDLSLRLYSNLAQWVQQLDEQIEKKLAIRLQTAIIMWTNALKQGQNDENQFMINNKNDDEVHLLMKMIYHQQIK